MEIERLADACGGLAWISERLFEIEGRMAASGHSGGSRSVSHAAEKGRRHPQDNALARMRVLMARSSRQHGQHAQWWRDALPDSPALDAPSRIRPPSASWSRLLDYANRTGWLDAVVALYGVALPELIKLVDKTEAELSLVSDGPVIRIARMVRADLSQLQADARPVMGSVGSQMFQTMAQSSEVAQDVWKGKRRSARGAD